MKLLKHQEKFAKGYKNKDILAHETGTGKTVCACVWLKDDRDSDALIICPKRVVKKWEKELLKWGAKGTVISKETLKKTPIKKWSAFIIDEADEFASPLFVKGRSQLSTALYELIRYNATAPILLLSATPVRSNPWNLHTLLTFKGKYIEWKKWREQFFELTKKPYLPYPAWLPKPNWRKLIRPVLEENADIVLLSDCVDELPSSTEEFIKVKKEPFFENPEWTPSAAFVAEHRHEQKNKSKEILEIAKDYRKILVVAHYVEQTEELKMELSKDRLTFMVNGTVKDQEKILTEANECDECFLIVQASLGAGFDANTFSCVIFASMGYAVRDFIQMKGRVRRIHDLRPVCYKFLLAGRCDRTILKNIQLGKEFVPSTWQPYESTESPETEEAQRG